MSRVPGDVRGGTLLAAIRGYGALREDARGGFSGALATGVDFARLCRALGHADPGARLGRRSPGRNARAAGPGAGARLLRPAGRQEARKPVTPPSAACMSL